MLDLNGAGNRYFQGLFAKLYAVRPTLSTTQLIGHALPLAGLF